MIEQRGEIVAATVSCPHGQWSKPTDCPKCSADRLVGVNRELRDALALVLKALTDRTETNGFRIGFMLAIRGVKDPTVVKNGNKDVADGFGAGLRVKRIVEGR